MGVNIAFIEDMNISNRSEYQKGGARIFIGPGNRSHANGSMKFQDGKINRVALAVILLIIILVASPGCLFKDDDSSFNISFLPPHLVPTELEDLTHWEVQLIVASINPPEKNISWQSLSFKIIRDSSPSFRETANAEVDTGAWTQDIAVFYIEMSKDPGAINSVNTNDIIRITGLNASTLPEKIDVRMEDQVVATIRLPQTVPRAHFNTHFTGNSWHASKEGKEDFFLFSVVISSPVPSEVKVPWSALRFVFIDNGTGRIIYHNDSIMMEPASLIAQEPPDPGSEISIYYVDSINPNGTVDFMDYIIVPGLPRSMKGSIIDVYWDVDLIMRIPAIFR
jgi:hypothetical protein